MAGHEGQVPLGSYRAWTGRRAFTLIELLVVLAIISMILSLAATAIAPLIRSSRLIAATDVLRSAVSKTRSAAVASRKSSTLDMSYTEEAAVTEKLSTSVILTAEDFERYTVQKTVPYIRVEHVDCTELREEWGFHPATSAWQICSDQTREMRRVDEGLVGTSYAWHKGSKTIDEPGIDQEVTVLARFRVLRVRDSRGEWGVGLLGNFVRNSRRCLGYRLAVRVQTIRSGWNVQSRAVLEKIYSPSNPNSENSYDATDPDPARDLLARREIDGYQNRSTAILTPGVWYRMKMNVKRENKVVTVAGKVWVEGAPESSFWTVGPVVDAWPGATLPEGATDNFLQGGEPFAGGVCGVWVYGAEVAVDDFSVDQRKTWLLPKGVQMRAMRFDTSTNRFEALQRYQPGSFPLSYRPDGTAATRQTVFLLITDVGSGHQRMVQIDHNTGRVESADELRVQR
jgi:prepilin-type N-terminal cleavage/methylation domain-containing protein